MSLENLKEISLFEGKTLDEIFGVIYSQSIEERTEAMDTFKKFKAMVGDAEDLFMSGDKPHPYLSEARMATENLIKMITASHKLIEMQGSNKEDMNATDILDLLDQEGIAPKRFLSHLEEKEETKEEEKEKKSNIDIVEFPKLNSKNV
tara:strand:+ start:330 stop:773 length:444 start_codon:yes stop_codon:yes gene_type:complete